MFRANGAKLVPGPGTAPPPARPQGFRLHPVADRYTVDQRRHRLPGKRSDTDGVRDLPERVARSGGSARLKSRTPPVPALEPGFGAFAGWAAPGARLPTPFNINSGGIRGLRTALYALSERLSAAAGHPQSGAAAVRGPEGRISKGAGWPVADASDPSRPTDQRQVTTAGGAFRVVAHARPPVRRPSRSGEAPQGPMTGAVSRARVRCRGRWSRFRAGGGDRPGRAVGEWGRVQRSSRLRPRVRRRSGSVGRGRAARERGGRCRARAPGGVQHSPLQSHPTRTLREAPAPTERS